MSNFSAVRAKTAAIICFLMVSCSDATEVGQQMNATKGQPIAGVQTYDLSNAEMQELSEAAEHGDVESSYRLALYYEFVKLDSPKAMALFARSAEHGHVKSQTYLGVRLLSDDEDQKSRALGLYWLKRAAKAGDEHARKVLESETPK